MTAHGDVHTAPAHSSHRAVRVAEVRPAPRGRGVRACARGVHWFVYLTALRLTYRTGISSYVRYGHGSCFIHLNKNYRFAQKKTGDLDNASHLSMAAKRASALAAHTYYLAAPLAAPPHELPDLLPDLLAIWVATLPLLLQLCPALLAPLRP